MTTWSCTGLIPPRSMGMGAAPAAKPPHEVLAALDFCQGSQEEETADGQHERLPTAVRSLPHWQGVRQVPWGSLGAGDPQAQPWGQSVAPIPSPGICSLSHGRSQPSTQDTPSQHSPKFPRGFLPRSVHGENREPRLCSGAGEHPAEFVSIGSQRWAATSSGAGLSWGPGVVPNPPGPARH